MATVVDFSAGVPSAKSVKSAGHIGAVRYISPPRESWMKGKPTTINELQSYQANGLSVAYVWQYGKESNADVLRGFEGGVSDARAALAKLQELRVPDHPVYFAVDFDINLSEWNRIAVNYFKGAASVLGVERVGIYGHSRVCAWAIEDGVIGRSSTPGKYYAWQTRSWSNGARTNECVLFQSIVDTPSTPGPMIEGVVCDVNEVLAEDWGQRPPSVIKEETSGSMSGYKPVGSQREAKYRAPGRFSPGRDFNRLFFGIVHTYECPPFSQGQTPEQTLRNRAAYQYDSQTGSYHFLVHGNGDDLREVDDKDRSWSAMQTGNNVALHVSALAYAANTRQEWLSRPDQLKKIALTLADWCVRYGFEPRFLSVAEIKILKKGLGTHDDISRAFGESDHTDPGNGFPKDVVEGYIREILSSTSEEDEMTNILNTPVPSLVEGSNFQVPLKDYIRTADKHAFDSSVKADRILAALTQINEAQSVIIAKLQEQDNRLAELEKK